MITINLTFDSVADAAHALALLDGSASKQVATQVQPAPAPVQAAPVQQMPQAAAPAPAQQQTDDSFPLGDAELQSLNQELNAYVQNGQLTPQDVRGAIAAAGVTGLAEITTREVYNRVVQSVRAAIGQKAA